MNQKSRRKDFAELRGRDISATWRATTPVRIYFLVPGLLTYLVASISVDFEYDRDGKDGERSASKRERSMQVRESSTSKAGTRKLAEYKMTYDHLIALISLHHQPASLHSHLSLLLTSSLYNLKQ